MSRLYGWLESDMSTSSVTKQANKRLSLTINYGSKSNSKRLAHLIVNWEDNNTEPKMHIQKGEKYLEF